MNEKNILENIYRMLDGELNAAEQEELKLYLGEHPEAAILMKQCEKVKDQFGKSGNSEVVPDLKSEILGRINWEQYKTKNIMEPKFSISFWQQPVFRMSFIFITGVFIGFLIFSFLKTDLSLSSKTKEAVKGTFAGSNTFENMKVADNLLYEGSLAKAVCNVRYTADIVEIDLNLSSSQAVNTILEFDNKNFTVLNIRNVNVNKQSTLFTAVNYVHINNTGDNKYIIQLSNSNKLSNDIAFKIMQDGQPLYQNKITINKSNN